MTERQIRDGIARLEASILHHLIERDGWRPDDSCYQKLVGEVVADLLRDGGDLPCGCRVARVAPACTVHRKVRPTFHADGSDD